MLWFLNLVRKVFKKFPREELDIQVNTAQHPKFGILVIGDLPYYVPVPEEYSLAPSQIGVEPFQIMFTHFKPLRHPDDLQGENVDDRIGTFLRTKCHISFPLVERPQDGYQEKYEKKSLDIVNNALRAIRYKAYDPAIRHIRKFENSLVQMLEFNADGTTNPVSEASLRTDYGPFGIRPVGVLKNDSLQEVWWYFNGLMPIPYAWYLILDSKYHNAAGDITHACLDLAIALEINIDGLVEYYSRYDPNLSQIDLDGKNIYQKYDEVMLQVTGHSLHEHPDHFVNLECIYAIRNSIAHAWKAEFTINDRMRRRTRYLDRHIKREGEVIQSSKQVNELIKAAEELVGYTVDIFHAKFDPTD